jgi:S-ribosylhomocysteine lyase LuxS involved in autoinducer biosynthesis
MKQTAVEWLIKKIAEDYPEIPKAYREECNKAKEMEKEQTVNFANDFYDDCVTEGGSLNQSAEEYYKQTYKQ